MRMLIAVCLLAALTACNTVAGFGTDITNSANWVKEKLGAKSVDLGPSSGDTQK